MDIIHEESTGTPLSRELLKTHELALLLRCTVRTVANLTRRRAIPVLKVGRHNRYNRGAVLAALERAGGDPLSFDGKPEQ